MSKGILNYSTTISAEKSVAEIQILLAQAKAQAVMTEYDQDGLASYVNFRIVTAHGLMCFRLPANVHKVYQVLVRNRKIPPKLKTREQATRVAWRIVKDWLEVQLAFIATEQVDVEQLFLFCAQNSEGKTVYDMLKETEFKGLALPPHENNH